MTSAGALSRRNDELEEQVASLAAKAEAEAAEARARLLETQGSLARLQETAERGDDGGPVEPEAPSMTRSAATEVGNALSTDAKRSLSAIFGLARTLSTHQVSKDDERLLHQLMTQAKRMEHAIGDIFDADRLTRGEPVLERRSTEIDTLVRRVVREFPFAEERDLDVSVETATVMVDRARVERLLDDLLTSAVARTETGDRIGLVLERAPDGVLISVEGGTHSQRRRLRGGGRRVPGQAPRRLDQGRTAPRRHGRGPGVPAERSHGRHDGRGRVRDRRRPRLANGLTPGRRCSAGARPSARRSSRGTGP